MIRRDSEKRGGFSVLEMVIASLLFTTVSLSFMGVFSHHYRAVARARTQLLAQHLCRAKMNDYTAAKFDGVDLHIAPNQPPALMETIPVELLIRDQLQTLQFEVYAENLDATAGLGGEKNVAVWVYWEEFGQIRSVVYRTLLAQNG